MELVLRTVTVYLVLLLLFRLVGQRTLSEVSTFDFVLLLIVSEATQNALLDDDRSVTGALVVILTLVMLDLALSALKWRSKKLERVVEGGPIVLVDHGRLLKERLAKTYVTEDDILETARFEGLERIEQIRYAVLETSGGISIVPLQRPELLELEQRIELAVQRALKHDRAVSS